MKNVTFPIQHKNTLSFSLLALSLATGFACSTSWADKGPLLPRSPMGEFYLTGRHNVIRTETIATTLANGKVLIDDVFPSGNTPDLYDPLTHRSISTGGRVTSGFGLQTAALLDNGKVLTILGNLGPTSADLYNPATNTFSATGSLINANYNPIAARLKNGQVLVTNHEDNPAELYDPVTETFRLTGKSLLTRISDPIASSETITLLQDGRVLIAGGFISGAGPFNITDEAELYDPATGMFTKTGNMNRTRANATATLLPNGIVLIAGGQGQNLDPITPMSTELYDPVTGSFFPGGNLKTGHSSAIAALLPSGKVLIAGDSNFTTDAEIYDYLTNSSSYTGNMVYGHGYAAATVLPPLGQSEQVLIFGGIIDNTGFGLIEGYTETVTQNPPPVSF